MEVWGTRFEVGGGSEVESAAGGPQVGCVPEKRTAGALGEGVRAWRQAEGGRESAPRCVCGAGRGDPSKRMSSLEKAEADV